MSLAVAFRRKRCLTVVAGVQARVRRVAYPLAVGNMSRPLLFHLRGGHQQNPRKEVIDERKGPTNEPLSMGVRLILTNFQRHFSEY